LAEALESFDPESWCSPSKLLGLANFVDGDGTHADRVFTPVGKGNEALQSSLCAAAAPSACWLPEDVLVRLRSSLTADLKECVLPWLDLGVGRGRLENSQWRHGERIQLSVVATLVDKLPNLAGLCRTCEMFHASSLVVADRSAFSGSAQFTSISLHAEHWLPIAEVRPDHLEAYLAEQRRRGFQVVAVEQTSTSTSLPQFVWPEKAVLLLGKEKEGIPAEYLRMVDTCVEIPQLGVIRSLNVHVSAAIMLYDCVRQSMRRGPARGD